MPQIVFPRVSIARVFTTQKWPEGAFLTLMDGTSEFKVSVRVSEVPLSLIQELVLIPVRLSAELRGNVVDGSQRLDLHQPKFDVLKPSSVEAKTGS